MLGFSHPKNQFLAKFSIFFQWLPNFVGLYKPNKSTWGRSVEFERTGRSRGHSVQNPRKRSKIRAKGTNASGLARTPFASSFNLTG
jgi:hypothetical protein